MKKYTVIASQLVFYRKEVEADSMEDAEEKAWEDDNGTDWKEYAYGDWELEDVIAGEIIVLNEVLV